MSLHNLGQLFAQYSETMGSSELKNCSCVISTDGAVSVMRELTRRTVARVSFNDDEDVLFLFDDVPVILRHRAPPGHAIIVEKRNVPPRSCCDATAVETMMLSLSRGSA